jgi:exodeoxyribonuclease VII small subunit
MTDQPDLSEPQFFTKSSEPLPADVLPSGWNYEATVAEVEAIIDRIERGELDLADVFDQFAIAVERLRQCESFLARQQQQVDLLVETLLDEPDLF